MNIGTFEMSSILFKAMDRVEKKNEIRRWAGLIKVGKVAHLTKWQIGVLSAISQRQKEREVGLY